MGNHKLSKPTGTVHREDDFASTGVRGLADFATAVFKCVESQARGFAHGHGKVHSIPENTDTLLKCLHEVVEEIEATISQQSRADALRCSPHSSSGNSASSDFMPATPTAEQIINKHISLYNDKLISSASTRQYESSTLCAKQLGQLLPAAPFSEKQQRQSRYDSQRAGPAHFIKSRVLRNYHIIACS
jgi:hypothetical protein